MFIEAYSGEKYLVEIMQEGKSSDKEVNLNN
jgi:hypothetical protein